MEGERDVEAMREGGGKIGGNMVREGVVVGKGKSVRLVGRGNIIRR